jgi:phosphoserine phosphatase
MQRQSVEAVIARMARVCDGAPHPMVVCDADGTLWSGDVGVDAFEALVEQRAVRPEVREPLEREAREHGLEARGDANELAASIWAACERGAFPERRCYEIMTWVFAGFAPEQAAQVAREAQARRGLERRLHAEMLAVVKWAAGAGVDLRVVSASPVFAVRPAVESMGMAADRVIAAVPAVVAGRIAPGMAEPIPYGEGKVRALRERAQGATVVGAFGDNGLDVEMMKLARVAAAVRPKPALVARAGEVPGIVELEPR